MAFANLLGERSISLIVPALLAGSYIIYCFIQYIVTSYRHASLIKANACKPVPKYPNKDPLFGLDLFYANWQLSKNGGLFEAIAERMANINGGVHTHSTISLGKTLIMTTEPENIKTILATKFKDWEIPTRRKDSAIPIIGHGIFTTDGKEWEDSRALLRPSFTRSHVGDLQVHEDHIVKLLARIPRDGSTVDMQELFFMLTLDSATDFLFGSSTDVLGKHSEHTLRGQKFGETWDYVTERASLAARIGKLATILPDRKSDDGIKYIHEYIASYVRKAFTQAGVEKPKVDKYVFLDELAKTGYGEKKIQDELLNILLAGRDTTAGVLSHLFYELSRRPEIYAKLRAEILQLGTNMPSFEQIKGLKYLQYCLNETLRLYPSVPINGRKASRDTVLPVGGGPDGKSPIFVPKGTVSTYIIWIMHRRKEFYGEDADEFKPERWETLRPGWNYLPFNGGPRICIGQQFALTEASYATIRLLQTFKSIENRDTQPYKARLSFTLAIQNGVHVAFSA